VVREGKEIGFDSFERLLQRGEFVSADDVGVAGGGNVSTRGLWGCMDRGLLTPSPWRRRASRALVYGCWRLRVGCRRRRGRPLRRRRRIQLREKRAEREAHAFDGSDEGLHRGAAMPISQ